MAVFVDDIDGIPGSLYPGVYFYIEIDKRSSFALQFPHALKFYFGWWSLIFLGLQHPMVCRYIFVLYLVPHIMRWCEEWCCAGLWRV